MKIAGGITFASFAGTYYATELEPLWVEVSQVEIPLGRLPKVFDGYRILQISDIHIGGWMNHERLADVVELALAQKPDLVVMTGDYVIGRRWDETIANAAVDFADVIKPLAEAYTTLGVLGNHDHWTDAAQARTMLANAGVIDISNDVYRIRRDGEDFYIAGVDDVSEGKHRLEEVVAKLPPDTATILLAHEPDYADVTSLTGKFLLQLSGHSHGGQVSIPFVGPPVLPRWARKYPAGLYRLAGMWLYTNRGVGMTAPFVRFNCRPEITVFTLNGAE